MLKFRRILPALMFLCTSSPTRADSGSAPDDACLAAILNKSIARDEAKLLIQIKRSFTYGVSFYYKQVDGKDRLLIILDEHPFKRAKQIELAEGFLQNDKRPILGDSEKLSSLPAASGQAVLLAVSEFGSPLSLLFSVGKRRHRFADASQYDVEAGWEPSQTAKIGYGMDLSSQSFILARNLAAFAVLADAASGLTLGPEYSFGLFLQMKDWIQTLPLWNDIAEFKDEHSWAFALGIPATFFAIHKFRKLRILYPPIVFHRERAESLANNIDQFWLDHPEAEQAVLVTGGYSSGALHWRMVRESGYQEVLSSELFAIANQEEPNTGFYRFKQKVRTTWQKWNRFRDRWIPPDED